MDKDKLVERGDVHEIVSEDLLTLNEFIQEHATVADIVVRGAFRRIEAAALRSHAQPKL